jgi:hypothetical protein
METSKLYIMKLQIYQSYVQTIEFQTFTAFKVPGLCSAFSIDQEAASSARH